MEDFSSSGSYGEEPLCLMETQLYPQGPLWCPWWPILCSYPSQDQKSLNIIYFSLVVEREAIYQSLLLSFDLISNHAS